MGYKDSRRSLLTRLAFTIIAVWSDRKLSLSCCGAQRGPYGNAVPMSVFVPTLDLGSQYHSIKAEIDDAIAKVVQSQQFILGPEVDAFEHELAMYCKTRFSLALSSGTDALLTALMALDIGPGDEVITTPFSFFATAGSIVRVGARPVFVDIDPHSFNLDPRRLESAITPRTKAIMPVHLYGQCADMDPINTIASKHRLAVIEDAAQAIGSGYKDRTAGGLGHIGCFSFFPSKNLGGFGDSGAVTTNDPHLHEKMKLIRTHGGTAGNYHHELVGANFRMDALQAAILRVKLRYLDRWTEARQRNAAFYSAQIAERGLIKENVKVPDSIFGRHIFNQYVIRAKNRDALLKHLHEWNIGARVYYPLSLHQQRCFRYLGYRDGDMPQSEAAARETLALPVYPELSSAQLRHVVDCLASFYEVESLKRAA
jgi:dTDP-4-amino-4,6-dideoxygalactose transaminase